MVNVNISKYRAALPPTLKNQRQWAVIQRQPRARILNPDRPYLSEQVSIVRTQTQIMATGDHRCVENAANQ